MVSVVNDVDGNECRFVLWECRLVWRGRLVCHGRCFGVFTAMLSVRRWRWFGLFLTMPREPTPHGAGGTPDIPRGAGDGCVGFECADDGLPTSFWGIRSSWHGSRVLAVFGMQSDARTANLPIIRAAPNQARMRFLEHLRRNLAISTMATKSARSMAFRWVMTRPAI